MQATATGATPRRVKAGKPREGAPAAWRAAVLAALALTLAATACSDDSGDGSSDDAADEAAAQDDSGDDPATESDDDSEAGSDPAATDGNGDDETEPAPEEPLATVEGPESWTTLEITDLRRVEDVVTLEFVLVVEAASSTDAGTQDVFAAPRDRLGEGEAGALDETPRQSVSGVTLVDVTNNQRHLVLRDAEGACLCTSFSSPFAETGRYPHSAQFPAPPDDVTTMTVQVPTFPAVDTVPLRTAG